MKKAFTQRPGIFNRISISSILVLLTVQCSGILEPQVYGDLTPETFFRSESDLKYATAALYHPFTTDWGGVDQGDGQWYASLYNADPKTYLMQSMITTDELTTPWTPVFTSFTFGPASLSGFWASTYAKIRFVARATDVIDKIEKAEAEVPDAVKQVYIAEAKVLRAWIMYILYDFYGPVNVKLDAATLSDVEITPRPSASEYVSWMIEDLTEAMPYLKEKYNNDAANWGRVSQGVARMLLLKIYMHEKNWAQAEATARELLTMNYVLLTNYRDVFNQKRNNEIIYAVPSSEASPNYYTQEILPTNFVSAAGFTRTAGAGWYGLWMPWSFYDTFTSTDDRRTTILASYVNNRNRTVQRAEMAGAIPLKYTTVTGPGPGHAIDQVVFRYAEVLLSLAEAINEQRGPADAYQYANQVRTRAKLTGLSGLTKEAFRDAMLRERGHELYAEGVRRQDLIRHGKFIEYARNRGHNAEPHHVLFPIPQYVIVQGAGVIVQNQGYSN
jgi:hypothetical protein